MPEALERRFHVVSVVTAFLVIDVGIAAFVLRASNALQLPIADLPYGDLQPFAEKTRFGVAFLVMTVGFGIVAALLLVAWVLDRLELRWPALVLSLALVSGLSLSGHQATEPNANWISEVADFLHLVAASVWVGGLAALAFLVWPVAPSLRRTAFLGFARLAVVLVAVMVLAGAYLALVRLAGGERSVGDAVRPLPAPQGRDRRASRSPGARCHHFVVRPRLEAGEEPDVHPSLVGEATVALRRPPHGGDPDERARLRRSTPARRPVARVGPVERRVVSHGHDHGRVGEPPRAGDRARRSPPPTPSSRWWAVSPPAASRSWRTRCTCSPTTSRSPSRSSPCGSRASRRRRSGRTATSARRCSRRSRTACCSSRSRSGSSYEASMRLRDPRRSCSAAGCSRSPSSGIVVNVAAGRRPLSRAAAQPQCRGRVPARLCGPPRLDRASRSLRS